MKVSKKGIEEKLFYYGKDKGQRDMDENSQDRYEKAELIQGFGSKYIKMEI